jgi:hypothetical protein
MGRSEERALCEQPLSLIVGFRVDWGDLSFGGVLAVTSFWKHRSFLLFVIHWVYL